MELYRTASARANVRPARASCSATATAVRPANDPRSVCGTVSAWRFPARVIYLRIVHNIIMIIYMYIYLYTRLWVHNMIYHFLFIIFYDFYITSLYTRTHTPVLCHIIMYTLCLSLRVSSSLICSVPYCCRRYYFCSDRYIVGIYLFYYGRLYIYR